MADAKIDVKLPRKVLNTARSVSTEGTTDPGRDIPRQNTRVGNSSIQDVRARGLDEIAAIRELSRTDSFLSSAIYSMVEVANTDFSLAAYDPITHEFDPAGTAVAKGLEARINTVHDYTKGFADKRSLQMIVESSLLEVIVSGGLAQELVLDKQRLPDKINTVPYEEITWRAKKGGRFPIQKPRGKDDVVLDIPTFFVSESFRQSNYPYARPMMRAAVQEVYQFSEFLEDMHRALKRQGHGRLDVSMAVESLVETAPDEIKSDPEKLTKYLEQHLSDMTSNLEGLTPEQALVHFDSVTAEILANTHDKSDYVPLMNALSGRVSLSMKTTPSVLGLRLEGSQSLSNTESLIYLRVANSIRRPVEENLSRIFTLAVRLVGIDAYVKFRFDPINLRPEDELEAFKTMKNARVMDLLSEGFYSDEEAANELGTGPREPGAPPLSGTGFKRTSSPAAASVAEKVSPNADPQGRALQPDTPKKAGGESQ